MTQKMHILFAFVVLVVGFVGCTSQKVQVIHNPNVMTNIVSHASFNDENYIWESWTIGTNKVDKID